MKLVRYGASNMIVDTPPFRGYSYRTDWASDRDRGLLRATREAQNTFPRAPHETGSAAFDRIWVFSRHSTCMGRSTRFSAPAAEACVDAGAGGVIGALALAN